MEITEQARDAGGRLHKGQQQDPEPPSRISLRLENDSLQSQALLHFDEQAAPGKDPLDAWQLAPLSAEYLTLYSTTPSGQALDLNALPADPSEIEPMALDFGVR